MLLTSLRAAESVHLEVNGAYVACGPVPKAVPKGPVPWPSDSCFERLAFAPKGPVRAQLEAVLREGRLVLVARADPDGDGVPQVWYMDEDSQTIRGFGSPPADEE